jgi:hypothetical protein
MPFRFLKKLFGSDEGDAPPPPAPPATPPPTRGDAQPESFRSRVDAFWRWFAEREEQLRDELRAGRPYAEKLSAAIAAMSAPMAWETCPSDEEGREGLAFSGEADRLSRLMVRYVVRRAPPLEKWVLFTSKQPQHGSLDSSVSIGTDEKFHFSDFRFGVDFDPDERHLEVRVHHPRFGELPESARSQLTFIALDSALGENLVETWIGPIEPTTEASAELKYTIDELRRQARAALSLHDLDPDVDPLDVWSSYQMREAGDGDVAARADIIAGTTCVPGLVGCSEGENPADELVATGAGVAYVMLPIDDFTVGQHVEQRGRIEDRLGERLRAAGAGDQIGGATGHQYAYVDLILFDEAEAVRVLRETLPEIERVSRAVLRYFADARRDEHVVLFERT